MNTSAPGPSGPPPAPGATGASSSIATAKTKANDVKTAYVNFNKAIEQYYNNITNNTTDTDTEYVNVLVQYKNMLNTLIEYVSLSAAPVAGTSDDNAKWTLSPPQFTLGYTNSSYTVSPEFEYFYNSYKDILTNTTQSFLTSKNVKDIKKTNSTTPNIYSDLEDLKIHKVTVIKP